MAGRNVVTLNVKVPVSLTNAQRPGHRLSVHCHTDFSLLNDEGVGLH